MKINTTHCNIIDQFEIFHKKFNISLNSNLVIDDTEILFSANLNENKNKLVLGKLNLKTKFLESYTYKFPYYIEAKSLYNGNNKFLCGYYIDPIYKNKNIFIIEFLKINKPISIYTIITEEGSDCNKILQDLQENIYLGGLIMKNSVSQAVIIELGKNGIILTNTSSPSTINDIISVNNSLYGGGIYNTRDSMLIKINKNNNLLNQSIKTASFITISKNNVFKNKAEKFDLKIKQKNTFKITKKYDNNYGYFSKITKYFLKI
ncbi:MAG: hypothetical protein GY830_03515 [Bacteroidetes bacterium]|nr:hypothetical protein [Bacteroidota bacterium]